MLIVIAPEVQALEVNLISEFLRSPGAEVSELMKVRKVLCGYYVLNTDSHYYYLFDSDVSNQRSKTFHPLRTRKTDLD